MKNSKNLLYFILLINILLVQCQKETPLTNNQIEPHDFLSEEKYNNLIVEVQALNGFQPTTAAINNLKAFLEKRLNKSAGIVIKQNNISSTVREFYSLDEIKDIEKNNRFYHTKDKTLTAYFLFVDGDYAGNSGDSKVLGIAYGSSSMVIFEKTIRDYSGGIGAPSEGALETTVVNHEFGHILGLVNNGTPSKTSHQDAAHGKHCNVKNCLMYYNAETTDIVANIFGSGIPELDTNCINDLKANGGK